MVFNSPVSTLGLVSGITVEPSRLEEGTDQYLYDTSDLWRRAPDLDIDGIDQSSEILIGLPDTDYCSEVLSSGEIVGLSLAMEKVELKSNSESELNP
ncbi:hypothetical protein BB560_004241 [Smittium megazygosporum]|uniref:Uncharacterized protein n=1 Tax=Smittium megazygosporum TaxID=133381 RepID=A0A2T9Z9R2_9FUNG|nr:hypothetical protein BB560_004241 [Smittium megazygosporum]